jgi:hypothetical protein
MDQKLIRNVTTGLTGAVALAGATQAYGAVVQATPPATITGTGTKEATVTWDVNGDGTDDFIFGAGAANIGGSKYLAYTGVNAYGGAMVGYILDGAYNYASNLTKGTAIGSTSYFVKGTYLTTIGVKYGTTTEGQFKSGTAGYLGFEFDAADGTHYGYIELTSTLTSTAKPGTSGGRLTFGTAFYDTTPGEAITIGTQAIPEPSSLAALAFGLAGTAGVALSRRKRTAAPVC